MVVRSINLGPANVLRRPPRYQETVNLQAGCKEPYGMVSRETYLPEFRRLPGIRFAAEPFLRNGFVPDMNRVEKPAPSQNDEVRPVFPGISLMTAKFRIRTESRVPGSPLPNEEVFSWPESPS